MCDRDFVGIELYSTYTQLFCLLKDSLHPHSLHDSHAEDILNHSYQPEA